MSISVANAPCSWGVLEFEEHAPSYGYSEVLDQIAASGYAGTELGDWGFMPTEPSLLHDQLHRRSLALVGAFVPVALSDPNDHLRGLETAIRTAALMRDAGFPDACIVLADRSAGQHRANLAGGTSDGGRWSQSRPVGRLRPRLQRHRPDGLPVRRAANRLSSALRILRGNS